MKSQKEYTEMTTDAKVGLLLGLVFIVIIAFVINGLPDFVGKFKDKPVVETAVTTHTGGNLVIEPAVVDVARSLQQGRTNLRYVETPAESTTLETYSGGSSATETVAAAVEPQPSSETQSSSLNPIVNSQTNSTMVLPQVQQDSQQAWRNPQMTQTQRAAEDTVSQVEPAETPKPAKTETVKAASIEGKTHTVNRGESLGSIAKIYYGPEAGNQRAAIQRIYEANKSVLDSPNKLQVGDKLIIPDMGETPATVTVQAKPDESKSLMNKFKDVFVTAEKKPEAAAKTSPAENKPKASEPEKKAPVKQTTIAVKNPVVEEKPRTQAVNKTDKAEKKAHEKTVAVSGKTKTTPKIEAVTYTIQGGDSPYKIAQKVLGDGNRYPEILAMNKDQISNPSKLVVGTKIRVPKR
jgi:nucleoid-associated protein YgaU